MTISVALCTYNGVAYVDKQLRSIEQQVRRPDELVIIDDASSDGTWELLLDFRRRTRLKVVLDRNACRLGSVRNFERSIESCSGDIIALSDQDDVWLPQKLAALETAFTDECSTLVFSDAELLDESFGASGRTLWRAIGFERGFRSALIERPLETLIRRNFVTGACTAFRRELRDLALPFPASLVGRFHHDGWIACIAASMGRVLPLQEPLLLYRIHSRQQVGLGGPPKLGVEQLSSVSRQVDQATAWITDLAERLEGQVARDAKEVIGRAVAHFTTRQRLLARPRMGRLPSIIRELGTGRYQTFSAGILSAGADFLAR